MPDSPPTWKHNFRYVSWLEHERLKWLGETLALRAEVKTLHAQVQDLANEIVRPLP